MRIAIFRRAHFNAAHRLYRADWSFEKNEKIFGLCNNPNFHGHNYELEVKVTGEINPKTGMVMNIKTLKTIIYEHVEKKFDHKNLNMDIPELTGVIPTSENLCYLIWQILREQIDSKFDLKVRLYETPRNYVEYPAE